MGLNVFVGRFVDVGEGERAESVSATAFDGAEETDCAGVGAIEVVVVGPAVTVNVRNAVGISVGPNVGF